MNIFFMAKKETIITEAKIIRYLLLKLSRLVKFKNQSTYSGYIGAELLLRIAREVTEIKPTISIPRISRIPARN
jgi:hypothetical protein